MFSIVRSILLAIVVAPHAVAQTSVWSPTRQQGDEVVDLAAKQVRWPAPVRLAHHQQVTGQEMAVPGDPVHWEHDSGWDSHFDATLVGPEYNLFQGSSSHHRHQVIRSPSAQKRSSSGGHRHALGGEAPQQRPPKPPLHPSYHLRHSVQAPTPTLPGAKQRQTWKMPYSYGYFGASSTRHWNQHTGYRDRYTEWRLR